MIPSMFLKFTFLALFAAAIFTACSSDDNETPEFDLTTARLEDFPLNEVEAVEISIVHPIVTDGNEVTPGTIDITIPYAHTSLLLSLKSFDLSDQYDITPAVGSLQDFSEGEVIYTITSIEFPDKQVHYRVTVTHGGEPFFENGNITAFSFNASDNAGLASTIDASEISADPTHSEGVIIVIVPEGTDFSSLKPAITYDAAKLYYNAGAETKVYPAEGMTVDFKYPKRFSIQAENSLGVKSKVYQVIVDVSNPIKFEPLTQTTPNVETGDGSGMEVINLLATWTNVGNHPVTGMSADEHMNKTYPVEGFGDTDIITVSLENPLGGTPGVLPGEQGNVVVKVKKVATPGLFSTTAVFSPTFSTNTQVISFFSPDDRVKDIFETSWLKIESTLED
jgi:hypothetical protein